MIYDRGTKKWNSMMLVEHAEKLESLWKELDKIERPLLDEQQLLEIEYKIRQAHHFKKTIKIEVYKDGFIQEENGVISYISLSERFLKINHKKISFINILNVELYEDNLNLDN